MKNINLDQIKAIIESNYENGFWRSSIAKSTELQNHDKYLFGTRILKNTLTNEDVFRNYQLGSKEVNKLKRIDPNKPIIDAYDIDWTGYEITFEGYTYKPKTTFELLDLIFMLISRLHELHLDEDVIWNDNGGNRTENHVMNWYDGDPTTGENSEDTDDTTLTKDQQKYTTKRWNSTNDPEYITE